MISIKYVQNKLLYFIFELGDDCIIYFFVFVLCLSGDSSIWKDFGVWVIQKFDIKLKNIIYIVV